MKNYLLIAITFFTLTATGFSQQKDWDKWDWLLGKWQGEGSGQPGQGDGAFTFAFELDRNIIVRKSSTEFPATDSKPKFVHDDILIVYMDYSGNPSKAIYFDNEGHVIYYTVSYLDKSIIFLSDAIPNAPFFRLSYTALDEKTVNIKFEMSQDGEIFMTYIEGKSRKLQPSSH